LELEGDKRSSSFYLGHFSLSKSFDHIIKDANIFILSWARAMGLVTSQLPPLQYTPPITTVDLLQAIGFGHVNMADLSQTVSYGHT
jgi:hypothetical protein